MGRHAARKPCPFCEWEYTDRRPLGGWRSTQRGQYVVICCACKAMGPVGGSKEEADSLWNRAPRRFDVITTEGSNVVMLRRPDVTPS